MSKQRSVSTLTALVLSIAKFSGFAQPANSAVKESNLWFNELIFLPGGFRQMAKTISATNETFRLALRYIGEERAGKKPSLLPAGLTESDISNAEYMVSFLSINSPAKKNEFLRQSLR